MAIRCMGPNLSWRRAVVNTREQRAARRRPLRPVQRIQIESYRSATRRTAVSLSPRSLVAACALAAACRGGGAPAPGEPGFVAIPPPGAPGAPATPTRLRRLTNGEMENVLADLLGARLDLTRGFLPDPRVEGYDDDALALGSSASKVEEVRSAAERAAGYVSAHLGDLAPCAAGQAPVACARSFAAGFGTRAWGRPPSEAELDRLMTVFSSGLDGGDQASGIGLVVEAIVGSPYFLYRTELGDGAPEKGLVRLTPAEVASSLSFLLMGSRPDATLRARGAELLGATARMDEARRLLDSAAGRRQQQRFLRAWLGLTDVASINKDIGANPAFTPSVRQAMDRELDTFVEQVLTQHQGKLDELMTADYTFPGPAEAPIYGADLLAPPGDFSAVMLDPRRRGLLSSPAFLAAHALINQTNPVERGLMVRTRLLCQEVAPPPPSVNAVPPPSGGTTTTRAKYAAHSQDPLCAGCHQLMDTIGFGFESFDTLGRYRTMEAGQPVDSSGALLGTDVDGPFNGPAELSLRLPRSALFRRCFVKQLWRFAEGRSASSADDPELDALAYRFDQLEHRVGDLLVELVGRPNFVLRVVTP
jgi:hypothetical protein